MMLLITNENYDENKIQNLISELKVRGVKVTKELSVAKDIISHHNAQVNLLVINSVVVDDLKHTLEEIKSFSDFFRGPILIKVDDDKVGIQYMKEGLVNDYYVASNDKVLEFERLKKAFRIATLRSRVSNTLSEIKDSLAIIENLPVVIHDESRTIKLDR